MRIGLRHYNPTTFSNLNPLLGAKKTDSLMRTPRAYAKYVFLSLAIHINQ